MDQELRQREQVSALADGQLRGAELFVALEEACGDAQARESWHLYHLVGDVLRSRELAACRHDLDFLTRLNQRLRDEALSSAPAARPAEPLGLAGGDRAGAQAANESVFRWKLVAGLASVAAVAVVSWLSIFGSASPGMTGAQLAHMAPAVEPARPPARAAQIVAATPDGAQVMIRDPQLDAMLAAHRQLGGASALQNPSGFLRNATFDVPAR